MHAIHMQSYGNYEVLLHELQSIHGPFLKMWRKLPVCLRLSPILASEASNQSSTSSDLSPTPAPPGLSQTEMATGWLVSCRAEMNRSMTSGTDSDGWNPSK